MLNCLQKILFVQILEVWGLKKNTLLVDSMLRFTEIKEILQGQTKFTLNLGGVNCN